MVRRKSGRVTDPEQLMQKVWPDRILDTVEMGRRLVDEPRPRRAAPRVAPRAEERPDPAPQHEPERPVRERAWAAFEGILDAPPRAAARAPRPEAPPTRPVKAQESPRPAARVQPTEVEDDATSPSMMDSLKEMGQRLAAIFEDEPGRAAPPRSDKARVEERWPMPARRSQPVPPGAEPAPQPPRAERPAAPQAPRVVSSRPAPARPAPRPDAPPRAQEQAPSRLPSLGALKAIFSDDLLGKQARRPASRPVEKREPPPARAPSRPATQAAPRPAPARAAAPPAEEEDDDGLSWSDWWAEQSSSLKEGLQQARDRARALPLPSLPSVDLAGDEHEPAPSPLRRAPAPRPALVDHDDQDDEDDTDWRAALPEVDAAQLKDLARRAARPATYTALLLGALLVAPRLVEAGLAAVQPAEKAPASEGQPEDGQAAAEPPAVEISSEDVGPAELAAIEEQAAREPGRKYPYIGLRSASAMAVDVSSGEEIYAQDADTPRPIASLTKLMSAMVYLDTQPDLEKVVEITREDRTGARPATSRLYPGYQVAARDLLASGLMASDNPSMEALVRASGLERDEFLIRMTEKAQLLGMDGAVFYDPSGLDERNVATARGVVKMLEAALTYPMIADLTTREEHTLKTVDGRHSIHYVNSNRMARSGNWDVLGGKTGYITDAGFCLTIKLRLTGDRKIAMAFLGAPEKLSRFGDASRLAHWALDKKSRNLQASR